MLPYYDINQVYIRSSGCTRKAQQCGTFAILAFFNHVEINKCVLNWVLISVRINNTLFVHL